ncbi:NB-ARC domain, LRR domain containing protein [Trema orientale]|uniref:NB-ARC domain, LRR domain containing protein n=1 Tax=Trema orientale TaxID=63057 RepID=A0A2P5EW37_TREOI|nr:NB-ARC domain, LRR domain containing protein [Trema orientale]
MGDLVGGALLSAFLEALFDKLASEAVRNFLGRKKPVARLLDELNTILLSANALLNDAEEKQIRDQEVQKWLVKLKDVVYDADDLVDKIDTEALRCKLEDKSRSGTSRVLMKIIPSMFTAFDNTVVSEIVEILERLKILVDQKDALGLKERAPNKPLQRPPAPLVEESSVYGRDEDREVIIKFLLSDAISDTKISVIPIVGMGDNFDIFKITKVIFESVTSQKCCFEDLFQLQLKLKEALRGKKFLFIHDDVWNENYTLWDVLKSCFESGARGSKIIVTTRSSIVASIMTNGMAHHLAGVSYEDCWRLFVKHAFSNDKEIDACPNLRVIGREIVKKCKGLPLAVKSIGGSLRSKRNPKQWESIMKSDMWELYEEEGYIFPALWLSYRHLPAHLKRCFAYCSMFPKDYEFEKEKVILLWMAEGLLHPNRKGKRLEEVGEEYFQDLLSRSLLERSSQDESTLLMHDLVHDLATFVSGEFCFWWDYGNDLHKLTSKTRHLSYRRGFQQSSEFEGLSTAKRLRTFVALPLTSCRFADYLAPHELLLTIGQCLRVLSLCESSIEELPDSIGSLRHLRYLDFSYTKLKKISNCICTLYNLQTLLLSNCKKLTQLPADMGNLINLRHLDITEVPLKEMPLQMCNMKDLQTLPQIVLGDEHSGFRIKDLRDLRHLGGKLRISGLENVVDVGDVSKANLKDKKCLTELSLRWNGGCPDNSQKEKEILDALQPHVNLKELNIQSFRGTRFPDWVGNRTFSNIISICLRDCKSCCFLPPLGQLPSLKYLMINGFDSVVTIGDEFYCNGPSFISLECLWISYMSELKEWSFMEATQAGGVFPCLKILCLEYCPKLKVGLPCCLPSLSQLGIRNCKQMGALLPRSQQIDTAFTYLEFLSISGCPKLESLLEWGPHSKLKELCLFGCKKLFENHMHWYLQRLSSLKLVNIWGWDDKSFPEERLLPNTLTSLYIQSCRHLEFLNGKAFEHLASLDALHIRYCDKLRCLPEEGLSSSLSHLYIDGCPLLNQRCRREGEDWHKIVHISSVIINDQYI